MRSSTVSVPATLIALGAALAAPTLSAQDPVEQRVQRLEQENEQLRTRLDEVEARALERDATVEALGEEVERFQLGDVLRPLGEGRYGFGPAASKVYGVEQGLSIGGYGEFLYEEREAAVDRLDALRSVLYVGYKFDEHWVLNTEIEFEHATTSASSGTTDSEGSVSLEFGYLDYLAREEVNVRAGLLLLPVGLINELHEPTTFLGAQRPEVEERILPTTWRAPGAGLFGDVGGFTYRVYGVSSLDGEEFGADGLRGGRQKGNRSAADDFALAARLDWTDTPGLLVGASIYHGDTGQDGLDGAGNPIPDLTTTLVDLHLDWRTGPLWIRALWASAFVDDTSELFAANGTSLAERMDGWYVEAGYDLLAELAPESGQALYPFVRYEEIDTQAELAAGVPAVAGNDSEILTFGLHWRPIPQVVVKTDWQAFQGEDDRFDLLLGYVF